jgi:hypothetical protein
MQQYTRLVLLTVEVVAAQGLATSQPLRPPDIIPSRPSGYCDAFTSACSAAALDLDAGTDENADLGRRGAGSVEAGGRGGLGGSHKSLGDEPREQVSRGGGRLPDLSRKESAPEGTSRGAARVPVGARGEG